ncbi:hypothetical protein Maq22A_c13485 [Methylobacterium aquaticum]|uniref:Uncharacterized protein n=1 Tax=Methylobacterium aquaticum TaxID=270351 RepID=A0A0C6F037_9HYPH|nr:hypothetical protein Maq22A_c13485 [Methylobacterium aquaticum]
MAPGKDETLGPSQAAPFREAFLAATAGCDWKALHESGARSFNPRMESAPAQCVSLPPPLKGSGSRHKRANLALAERVGAECLSDMEADRDLNARRAA